MKGCIIRERRGAEVCFGSGRVLGRVVGLLDKEWWVFECKDGTFVRREEGLICQ